MYSDFVISLYALAPIQQASFQAPVCYAKINVSDSVCKLHLPNFNLLFV